MVFFNIVTVAIAILFTLPVALSGKVTNPSRVPRNAVLLSKVSSLTLHHGKVTAARRVAAVPQLACVGPKDVCKLYQVQSMRCNNEGADYDAANIQWSCKASLPEEFKLGSTEVACEGYESSDDPYVLKGSCGVEYRLLLTDRGEEKYGHYRQSSWHLPSFGRQRHSAPPPKNESSGVAKMLFFIIFVAVLCIIIKGFFSQVRRSPPRTGRTFPNGGNNDDDDLPPPYDGPPPYSRSVPPKSKTQSTNARPSSSRSAPQRDQQQQGWRPGFWTGAAAGSAAAYLAASRGSTRNNTSQQEPRRQPPPSSSGQGTSWFSSPSSSSSPPAHSTTQHESTGFGGTKRR